MNILKFVKNNNEFVENNKNIERSDPMSYPLVHAKKVSYGSTRSLTSILYIVLHYTGNSGDTAMNNAKYFANGNTRSAGAHWFVSQDGSVVQSIPMKYTAWSVGDSRNGHGPLFGKCTNKNSVSIEMCDQLNKDASEAQIKAVRELIAYIKSQCPNIKDVVRHYDCTTKRCPLRYIDSGKWAKLKAAVTGGAIPVAPITPDKPSTTPTGNSIFVDGIVGHATIRKWQSVMGTKVDGVISGRTYKYDKYLPAFMSSVFDPNNGSSSLIKAVQKVVGVDDDGVMGRDTIKAIQKYLGEEDDGIFGKKTATALQKRLNTGKF